MKCIFYVLRHHHNWKYSGMASRSTTNNASNVNTQALTRQPQSYSVHIKIEYLLWTPLKNSSSDVFFFLYVESFPDWPIRYDLFGHVMTFQIHFCIRIRLPERNNIKPSLSSHFNHCLAVACYHVRLRNISNLRKSESACTSGSLLEHLSAFTSSKSHLPSSNERRRALQPKGAFFQEAT